jgi:hypothetical protein
MMNDQTILRSLMGVSIMGAMLASSRNSEIDQRAMLAMHVTNYLPQ